MSGSVRCVLEMDAWCNFHDCHMTYSKEKNSFGWIHTLACEECRKEFYHSMCVYWETEE